MVYAFVCIRVDTSLTVGPQTSEGVSFRIDWLQHSLEAFNLFRTIQCIRGLVPIAAPPCILDFHLVAGFIALWGEFSPFPLGAVSQAEALRSLFKQGPVLVYLGTCRVVTMAAFLVGLRQQTLSMLLYLIFSNKKQGFNPPCLVIVYRTACESK